MTAGTDWTHLEVEVAVSDYFDMLAKELRGQTFNKAEHNRGLQSLLPARTRGSIERKHQNISAVLIELGYPYIDGYKPLRNVQSLLREVVEERLAATPQLERLVETVVRAPVAHTVLPTDLLSICVPAPKSDPEDRSARIKEIPGRVARMSRNYLEIEARNQSLGRAGEELVMQFEHQRLWTAGKRTLAERIEHVSATRGDGLGYDIQSFEVDGSERLIEVKTTRFGPLTPFFASRNEVNVSEDQQETFHLYRLFKFTEQPRLFTLPGSLSQTCILEAVQFSATPD
jgi:hypothetical protein